jgi:hypothetical protein
LCPISTVNPASVHDLNPSADLSVCFISLLPSVAGKDTMQRIRARREAANLPRFTSGSSSSDGNIPATSSANLLDATLGPTSSKYAGKDADLAASAAAAAAAAAAAFGSAGDSKDAAYVAGVRAGSSSSEQPPHGMIEHHLPPKMADGLPMDEDTETDNLLEFKETPEEVRGARQYADGAKAC